MTPDQKAKLTRLRTDFPYWCRVAWRIIDKSGNLVPLVLNSAQLHTYRTIQEQEEAGVPIRLVILKGRQQGISTMLEAWQVWKTTKSRAKRAYVLAHLSESSDALFDMAKRGYEALPALLKPATKKANKRDLVFADLDSSLTVATAGGKGIGRGRTFQYCHASEVAFWEPSSAESNFNGLHQTIPNVPDSAMFVESTANGIGGLYHRLWTDAERGVSEFRAVFVPWFWQDEYRVEPPGEFEKTPEENNLRRDYGLDDAQLWWRRKKVAAVGLDQFNQEYPCEPSMAFLTSGRPVFEPILVQRMLEKTPEPLRRMAMEPDDDEPGKFKFVEHGRGELSVFHSPVPTESYFIGADVAEGVRDGDWSVAQVLDSRRRQVAVWRGLIYPDAFAEVLATLGDLYNNALVAVELNNHGILTANVLAKQIGYPDIYTEITVDKITNEETTRLGFSTNPKSRPMILHKLRAEVRDGTMEINDRMTLKEMLSFSLNISGRMEAEAGAHDDHVMALAIANHVNDGPWVPVTNTDANYHEAL